MCIRDRCVCVLSFLYIVMNESTQRIFLHKYTKFRPIYRKDLSWLGQQRTSKHFSVDRQTDRICKGVLRPDLCALFMPGPDERQVETGQRGHLLSTRS